MGNELFVGVADNNHFSTAVVGDSRGRIIATGVGESVNFCLCGVPRARENLKRLLADTVGWRERHNLACVCITFKSDSMHNNLETFGLVHNFFSPTPGCVLRSFRSAVPWVFRGGAEQDRLSGRPLRVGFVRRWQWAALFSAAEWTRLGFADAIFKKR